MERPMQLTFQREKWVIKQSVSNWSFQVIIHAVKKWGAVFNGMAGKTSPRRWRLVEI